MDHQRQQRMPRIPSQAIGVFSNEEDHRLLTGPLNVALLLSY